MKANLCLDESDTVADVFWMRLIMADFFLMGLTRLDCAWTILIAGDLYLAYSDHCCFSSRWVRS